MKFDRIPGLVLAATLFLPPLSAAAVTIPVANHSFEEPATDPGTFITNAPPNGWQSFGSLNFGGRTIGVVNPNDTSLYLDPVPDDDNVGVVFLLPSFSNSPAGLQQLLADTLQTLTEYTLTVEVGNMATDPDPPHNAFNFNGFPGYRVELLAGATVIASDINTLLPGEGRFLTSTVQVSIGASHPNAGQALTVRLVNLDSAAGIEVNFDDVRLDAVAATPTPTETLTLTATATSTNTPTSTPTSTPTETPTEAASATATLTPTETPTAAATATESTTPTETPTPAGCALTPLPDCKAPVAGKAKLLIARNPDRPDRNSASWSWIGAATILTEFGTPLATTSYRLCGYDGDDDAILELTAAAGGSCGTKPCWRASSSGFKYRDRLRASGGLSSLALKAGAEGRASIKMKAKGANLIVPDLPLVLTPNLVRVQLVNLETDACWGASFSAAVSDPSSTLKWRGSSD